MTITESALISVTTSKSKLYLIPTLDPEFGQEWSHPKFSVNPSHLSELPNLYDWSESFVIAVMTKKIKDKFKNVKTLISYHDTAVHLGTIYKAANWKKVNVSNGGQWSRQTRNRSKVQSDSKKIRWEYQI